MFDKTGTLTASQPSVQKVIYLVDEAVHSHSTVIAAVMSAESSSEHPIGRAIFDYGKKVRSCAHVRTASS